MSDPKHWPLCVVCKKNRVPPEHMPVKPHPPVCDPCARAGTVR